MNRIEPQTIADFFAAHPDIKPIRNSFIKEVHDEIVGCCGLIAKVLGNHTRSERDLLLINDPTLNEIGVHDVADMFGRELGLNSDYSLGFCQGWDGECFIPLEPRSAYGMGITDGSAAWKSCHEVKP